MISFEQAYNTVMSSAIRLDSERVDFELALNRVLAEDVISDIDMPPFNKSAMDGFACRRSDLANTLEVIETIPAGHMPEKTIGKNQCSKIMTGSVVPDGADCVVMVEYTESADENKIRFTAKDTKDNICLKAEDIKKGQVVLKACQIIKPQHIAVLASAGCVKPLVSIRPKLSIIATGSELVSPGQRPSVCQIRNSNSFQLAAQARQIMVEATNYGIIEDTKEKIDAAIKKAISENDVIIISGGVSVGDYDFVKEILKRNDFELLFEKIAVKPGRPMVFGKSENSCCFGLPGNPVSTFVMFELLVKPFLLKMSGLDYKPLISQKTLKETIKRKKAERDEWMPVRFADDGKVLKVEYHGSAHINALCSADGLLKMPKGISQIEKDEIVNVRCI